MYSSSNEKFYKDLNKAHPAITDDTVDYLYKTMSATLSSADYIFKQSKLHPTSEIYPATELGKNLKTIASLIMSDINTKIYYVSVGSFDTHVGQDGQQKGCLQK